MKYVKLQLDLYDVVEDDEAAASKVVCRAIIFYHTKDQEIKQTGGPLYPAELKLVNDLIQRIKQSNTPKPIPSSFSQKGPT